MKISARNVLKGKIVKIIDGAVTRKWLLKLPTGKKSCRLLPKSRLLALSFLSVNLSMQ
jgi:molybdopterin-binding protein